MQHAVTPHVAGLRGFEDELSCYCSKSLTFEHSDSGIASRVCALPTTLHSGCSVIRGILSQFTRASHSGFTSHFP